MSARSGRRFHELSQTLLQLGAYACILALIALAGHELQADISARVLHQAAIEAGACSTCRAETAERPADEARDWMESSSRPPLRRSFALR